MGIEVSSFYVEKQIIVGHCDGWRHVMTIYDDPSLVKIEYQELREDKWVTVHTLESLWSENAILIGKALIELGEFIKQEQEREIND